jgi:uncharacterized protein (TIGR02246 family)
MSRVMLVAAGLLLIAAPAMGQSKAVVQRLDDQWAAAFNKGDAAALTAMYTDDAYVLPPGADLVQGKGAIQNLWSQTVQQLGDAKLTTLDVQPLGRSAAREVGTFTAKKKGQTPEQVDGKYVVVWRKVNGQWLLATDIWNMNK